MMIPFSKKPNGCPCYGCHERDAGCHGKCNRYKDWRKELDERNEKERMEKAADDVMSEHAKRKLWKQQRYPYNKKRYRERDDR